MAEVRLDRDEAEEGDLPPVCMRCGHKAVAYKPRKFHWYPMWGYGGLIRLFVTKRMIVQMPLCDTHAREWALWNGPRKLWGLRVINITEDGISLAGVSDGFADALEDYRDGSGPDSWYRRRPRERRRRPRPPVPRAAPTPSGGYPCLWLLLAGLLIPVLGCGVLGVLRFMLPLPPAPNPWPPPAPAGAASLQPVQAAVGTVSWAPVNPFPGNAPWPALALIPPKEVPGQPAAFTDVDLDRALTELKSPNVSIAADAARRLAGTRADERRRPEIARALESLIKKPDAIAKERGAQALVVWGTPESVPVLLDLLDHSSPSVRDQALAALAAIKDPKAAEPVARLLTDGVNRDRAVKTLQALGPTAEKPVQPYLKRSNPQVRIAACHVLEVVGTKESAAALEGCAWDPDPETAQAAQKALAAVNARP